jgi:hypothetical protein
LGPGVVVDDDTGQLVEYHDAGRQLVVDDYSG